MRWSRRWVWLAAGFALVVGGSLLAGSGGGPVGSPLASRAPEGYLALVRFLQANQLSVQEAEAPPADSGTFVLLADVRSTDGDQSLLAWASAGGRLVVLDPDSALVRMLGARPSGRIGGAFGTVELPADCVAPEAAAARRIAVRVDDAGLFPGPDGASCFTGDPGSFEVTVATGDGSVVLLGGSSPFTNELLREADNAALALAILAHGRVTFGPPLPASATTSTHSLWTLLPLRAKAVLVALGLGLVAFAFVRGRRLGRPAKEEPISPIAAGELVVATANLYRAARVPEYCGELLRTGTAERLAVRLGYPPRTPRAEVVRAVEELGVEAALARVLVGPEPRADQELMALGVELERLWKRVERGIR